MNDKLDRIYLDAQDKPKPFEFDEKVAEVFQDMISRSVPGYQQILDLLPTLVNYFRPVSGHYYDLGCSLGAGMIALAQCADNHSRRIIGIDNSAAMLRQAQDNITALKQHNGVNSSTFELECDDVRSSGIENAALVLMNFTLQFVPLIDRDALIEKVYSGLNAGGALVLSEKLKFSEQNIDTALIDLYHQYKADQGYSRLEIAQKRDAIENVLVPETLATHQQRLGDAGFSVVTPWVQNLQFVSILAIK